MNFAVIVFEIKTGRGLGLPKFADVRYSQDSMKKNVYSKPIRRLRLDQSYYYLKYPAIVYVGE